MEQFFLTLDDGNTKVEMDISMLASGAATDLGYYFEKGIEGFSQNYENALKCYESAAQKGDETALNNVGWMYLNGYAVTKDEKIATGYFYKAAINGSSCAMVNLGNIHESKKEYEAAWYWYLQAARLGDSKGIFNIANMLHWGWGVEKDYNAAYNIFKKLYDSDYDPATCFYLGYYAENGLVSTVDYESAHKYYKEGVFFDDKYCCTNLGRMYGLGIGCNKNSARAFALYDRAAELGDALGYTNIAWMYETGEFVSKDMDKAIEYYQKAADMCEENAIEALDRLKEEGSI